MIGWITALRIPREVYSSIGQMIRDFFGLAYFIDGDTPFNGAWWYISFAITLYLLFPLLYKGVKCFPKTMLIASFVFGIKNMTEIAFLIEWQRYLFVCCFGIFLANKNLINMILKNCSCLKRCIISAVACLAFFIIRCFWSYTFDAFLALAIIIFSVSLSENSVRLRKIVVFIGIHSGNVFLLHGLLYKYFLREFIYGFWYPILIWAVLMLLSLVVSAFIEWIKKVVTLGIYKIQGN